MIDIGGLVPLTSIDFPGKLSAVIFCEGCNWQCPYCHNTHLKMKSKQKDFSWENIYNFLKLRKGWIEAVVFSGGEPTMQKGLEECMQETKELGFQVGLHTSGSCSTKLQPLLKHVDWIGFDVKAPLNEKYDSVSGVANSHKEVLSSLKLLLASGINHELRLTWDKRFLDEQDITDVKKQLQILGFANDLKVNAARLN